MGFERCENILGVFVLHILSKMDKTVVLTYKKCVAYSVAYMK